MNFEENKKALAFARHCIGLDHKKPYKRHGRYFYRPYRNYYDASVKDCETWDLLVQAGYAEAEDPEEKLTAIQDVIDLDSHNSISKVDAIEALRWLVEEYI